MATDGVTPFEARVDALYASPLDEFVASRKRLADELKREGAAADARRFGALAKPTLSAWLTNQTVRHAPALVRELLAATDVVSAAQRKLPGSKDFAAAVAAQRRIVEQLTAQAQAVGAKLGGTGADVLDRVTNNFRWGAIPGPEREALSQGRLLRDVAAPGFGGFGDAVADDAEPPPRPAPPQAAPTGHTKSAAPSDKTDAGRKAEAARAAAEAERERKQSVARHNAALREAQRETTQARRKLERAERDHAAADQRVTTAETELASAKQARDAAEERRQAAATELASREAAEEKLHRTAPRPGP